MSDVSDVFRLHCKSNEEYSFVFIPDIQTFAFATAH